MTLAAFAAKRRRLLHGASASSAPASIDRYLLPAGRSEENPPAAVAAVDRWDRQTDGRKPDRNTDDNLYAVLENKRSICLSC